YHGHLETMRDVLLVVDACRRGILARVTRRLTERHRNAIRSGSVFVWMDHEAGMKRWTDGKTWSPSRVQGSWLVYKE
ncbi:gluconate transport inducer 1/Pac2, partial [Blastocladiella britannica]